MAESPETVGGQEAPEACAAGEETGSISNHLHPDQAPGEPASGTEAHCAAIAAAVEEIIAQNAALLRRLGDA